MQLNGLNGRRAVWLFLAEERTRCAGEALVMRYNWTPRKQTSSCNRPWCLPAQWLQSRRARYTEQTNEARLSRMPACLLDFGCVNVAKS
jgi:hypothetical protein